MMASFRPLETSNFDGIVKGLTQAVLAEVRRFHGEPSPEFRDRLAQAFARVITSEMDASTADRIPSLGKPWVAGKENSKEKLT
ncbi:hypothetical protein HYR54_14325 [Candidatus Acetothermia bacterium]|nr:hypothetical protein [Candidatus Acetothermia bacterium]MBI3460928.1 hypothetical protein [Candidatus Acetothermia bacterium]MBI3661177.1 hypothetical protein [Candidatus Acetothermia bacterium]